MQRIRQIIMSGMAATTLALASIGTVSAAVTSPKPITLSNANNGQTVHVQQGQAVTVRLTSTNWTPNAVPAGESRLSKSQWSGLASSNQNILSPINDSNVAKQANSDGSTTNTTTRNFRTVATGTASINATTAVSQVCGAGAACSQQYSYEHFHVAVVVDPSNGCVPKPGYACPF